MIVTQITPGSPAHSLGLLPNDRLLRINGRDIDDHVDYLFHAADEELTLEVERNGELHTHQITKAYMGDLGLGFDELKTRWCGDDCIFCFVHQNPQGVRPTLMVQDEDFRLSFLHGNYVTLDNLLEADFRRIIEMRLSPLYVSVHTTDSDLRRRMLRGKRSGELIPRMERLLEAGIQMHTQIVLVPGWNDGAHLEKTVSDLAAYHPGVLSVALVPVGLTSHRQGLASIRRLESGEMRSVIEQCERWRGGFYRELGIGFVYPADEFFLASGAPLPPYAWYDDFCQEENGVGMAREFVTDFENQLPRLKAALERRAADGGEPLRVTACTGMLGQEMFRRHLLGPLDALPGLDFELVPVENTFFGPTISIAGLLTGRCLTRALEGTDLSGRDLLLLPSNCTSEEDVFLDDVSLADFAERYPCPVRRGTYDIASDLIAAAESLSKAPTGAV
ncbi:DUF512 domain-containing protein [Gemmatimonadota bacterium]